MLKVVFAGCSFTAGYGCGNDDVQEKLSPFLWVNLCHTNIKRLADLELVNIGVSGSSNTEIFQNVVRYMSEHGNSIDTIFCQWTSMPRYNWIAGFELWDTSQRITNVDQRCDVNLNKGISWSKEYISDLTNRLRVMHHLHWEILKVVDYVNIIIKLANKLNIPNVFFINGLCPWDNNYFKELKNVKPESYTEFTKKEILNIDSRDDEDIYKLYKLAHQHYHSAGSILEHYWLNLYNSFIDNQVDVNYDNRHPGKKSNQLYYQLVANKLTQLNFI